PTSRTTGRTTSSTSRTADRRAISDAPRRSAKPGGTSAEAANAGVVGLRRDFTPHPRQRLQAGSRRRGLAQHEAPRQIQRREKNEAQEEEGRSPLLTRSARWLTFIETLKIRARDRRIIPLRYNAPQRMVWDKVKEKIDRREPIRLIILKARREGISTEIE